MPKPLLIFGIDSWDTLEDYARPELVSSDPENFERCVARERGQELSICRDLGLDVLFAIRAGSHVTSWAFHAEMGEYALWHDPATNGENLGGNRAVIRTHCNNIEQVLRAAENAGLVPLVNAEGSTIVSQWISWVKPDFLGRKVKRMPMSELINRGAPDMATGDGMIFIKKLLDTIAIFFPRRRRFWFQNRLRFSATNLELASGGFGWRLGNRLVFRAISTTRQTTKLRLT